MNIGYFYAVRGAIKQNQRMDSISNNLANVNTAGFKQDKVSFEDYIINSVRTDFSQGALRATGRELDVALQGQGFFKIQTPNGPAYTRNGTFHIDAQGNLVNGQGYQVLGEGGPVQLGELTGPLTVDSKGNITSGQEDLAVLALVELADTTHLKGEEGGLLVWNGPGEPAEAAALDVEVVQGHLEQSNVSVVYEMANMIESHRSFEAYIKAIQSFAEVDQKAAAQVGRLHV